MNARPGALSAVVRAGVGRHRVRTIVMTLTVLLAVAASVLATGLLVASSAPFDRAFAAQRGAQLTAQFDGAKVTAARLAATAWAPGVVAAAGPFPTVSASPRTVAGTDGVPAGIGLPPLTIAGRATGGGPVDDVTILEGRWAAGPGQIVLASDAGGRWSAPGQQLRFAGPGGGVTVTVVGIARSVSHTADAWVAPTQLPSLTPGGTPAGYQMLYRFAAAATDAEVAADRASIAAAVPAGAMTGAQSYLTIRQKANENSAAFVPFVAAFGVLGLAMSALIIGIVVSGAVGASIRRIGVLKSLGFTPAQVVRAFLGQALLPAAVGVVLGAFCANLLAAPVLREQADAFDGTVPGIPLWVDVAVAAAALAVVCAAALVPALRAGRLRTVEAISVGRASRPARGRLARRLTSRSPVSGALALGLAQPFARPVRSLVLVAAVCFGAVGVTFAIGLGISLGDIQAAGNPDAVGAVVVHAGGYAGAKPMAPGGPQAGRASTAAPAAVAAAIAARPDTRRYYGVSETEVGVAGLTGATRVIAYQGDSSWASYQMISGSWFTRPGEAVAGTRFLHAVGAHVGDTVTVLDAGHSVRLRIVGEALDLNYDGINLLTEGASLSSLGREPGATDFYVDLRPGTNVAGYISALAAAPALDGAFVKPNVADGSSAIAAMETLIAMLTLALTVVAALGVLNTVVLDTRERAHELGVFRALGMTPRQTIGMVVASAAGIGLAAGVVGVPAGIALHHVVVPLMGRSVGTGIPRADVAVFAPGVVAPLVLGGLVIAVAGALLPAVWAARTRAVTALRTE
ncbi:ABC transporter permease [Pseudofrankia sp. DC12]|uniref:ABC transporter permease n=1 Tax=Pseudofrankia sp. DC12 TaxID=683315 RepID=UPI0005F83AD1|nr:ABC transporter permease [Pseudofrankia sp. DC12]